jgi:hypothetical protein
MTPRSRPGTLARLHADHRRREGMPDSNLLSSRSALPLKPTTTTAQPPTPAAHRASTRDGVNTVRPRAGALRALRVDPAPSVDAARKAPAADETRWERGVDSPAPFRDAVTDGRHCARATTNDDYALSLLAGLVVIHGAFARAAVDTLLLDFSRRRRRAHTLCRLPLGRAGAQADQQHKPHDGPNRALSARGHATEYAAACGCYGCDAPLHADPGTHGERDAEPLLAPLLRSLPLGGYVPLATSADVEPVVTFLHGESADCRCSLYSPAPLS